MDSTACTALHARHSVTHSTICTELHHDSSCLALRHHSLHSTALMLVCDVLCSYFARGCALTGLSPKIYGVYMCACRHAAFCCQTSGMQIIDTYRWTHTDRQIDQKRRHSPVFPLLLLPLLVLSATKSSATITPDVTCLSVRQFVHLATCWSVHLSDSDWLSEAGVRVCRAAGARGLASGWRGMGRAEPPMPSAPRSALYSSCTKNFRFVLSKRMISAFCFTPPQA